MKFRAKKKKGIIAKVLERSKQVLVHFVFVYEIQRKLSSLTKKYPPPPPPQKKEEEKKKKKKRKKKKKKKKKNAGAYSF